MAERRVVTSEELSEYERIIDGSYMECYIILFLKNAGISIEEMANQVGINAEEITKMVENVFPDIDINTVTAEEILAKVPSVYRDVFLRIGKKYVQGMSILDMINLPEVAEFWQISSEQERYIADILSSSDLSQIPAEIWNDSVVSLINHINFENTGANIDMQNWDEEVKYRGSFKGCNLISFDTKKYAGMNIADALEPEQYDTYMASFYDLAEIPYEIGNLLEEDNTILEKYPWILEKANGNVRNLIVIWDYLDEEQKNEFVSKEIAQIGIDEKAIQNLREIIKECSEDERKKYIGMLTETQYADYIESFHDDFSMLPLELIKLIKDDKLLLKKIPWIMDKVNQDEYNLLQIWDSLDNDEQDAFIDEKIDEIGKNQEAIFSLGRVLEKSSNSEWDRYLDKISKRMLENENVSLGSFSFFWKRYVPLDMKKTHSSIIKNIFTLPNDSIYTKMVFLDDYDFKDKENVELINWIVDYYRTVENYDDMLRIIDFAVDSGVTEEELRSLVSVAIDSYNSSSKNCTTDTRLAFLRSFSNIRREEL